MQRHTGVKEYVCGMKIVPLCFKVLTIFSPDLCGKETSTRALLDKHLLTHGTNNAFQCNICNRSYRHQSTLSRHSKMHTHICKCQICYQTFRYDSHLRKHLLDIHQDVNGINQPRTSQEVVKSKKKPATQIETEQTIVDSNVYYHAHHAPSTVVVNNVVNFKSPFGQ